MLAKQHEEEEEEEEVFRLTLISGWDHDRPGPRVAHESP
jgi:hypothetical protein